MSSSFVWIFSNVPSSTPSLMLSTMLLVTNFTAHSIGFEDLESMDPTRILDSSSLTMDGINDEKLQTALMWISQEGWTQFNREYRSDEVIGEDPKLYEATELKYLQAIADEPDNLLLLSNYAQFLYLIVHDLDRAELYFKRSVVATPADAEEAFLDAIDVSGGNPHHVGSYANFLWHTGSQDTCCTESLDTPVE